MNPAEEFLVGGGEMGERMRASDWAATSLGPISGWPQSLKSAVSILLPSKAQICLFWGPELVTLYNDAYRPVLGVKHPRVLGLPARECWSEIWEVLGPLLDGVVATGEAFWARDHLFYLQRSGYSEETYFDVSYDPVRDESGRVGGVFCIVSETTGRVLGERRLRTLRDLGARTAETGTPAEVCRAAAEVLAGNPADIPFARLYLTAPSGGAVRLAAGTGGGRADGPAEEDASPWPFDRVARTGAAELVGEVADRLMSSLAGPDAACDRALVLPLAGSTSQTLGFLVAGVSRRLALVGDYRDFFDLVAARISAAIASALAHEEERRRAAALAELDRAKTAFFSNVSHEFRTPLTLMLGPLEDMLARGEAAVELAEIALVQRNALRLLKLVNTLLDFSRIEAGRVLAIYQPTELAALTADLASVFRSAIESGGLRLRVDCEPLSEPVFVDRDMWEKIVLNLISNAFKFTLDGEIEVSLCAGEGAAELRVRDTGEGIPADEVPRLFERFHRVEGTRGRTYEGSGIGLALVQELVKLHGGSIRVESARGQGSTFVVSVPLGKAHLPPDQVRDSDALAQAAAGPNPFVEEALHWLPQEPTRDAALSLEGLPLEAPLLADAPSSGRPRVLLADDNADMRAYLRHLLSGRYEFAAAANGEAALELAREQPPDLVLTDVMMPGLGGFGLLRELRRDPRTSAVPVIVLSARAGEDARVEGLQAGADDYLVKPFSARELLARIEAHLQIARLRCEAVLRERELQDQTTAAQRDLADVLANVRDAFYTLDRDFRFTYVNEGAREMARLSREEMIGHSLWELYPSLVGGEVDRAYRRALAEDVVVEVEDYYTPWDRWFENRVYPSPRGLSVFTRDITERKQAAAERERLLAETLAARREAEEANRAKDEFLATLSHELRTPLNAIVGWAELLSAADPGAEPRERGLAAIVRNARAQARLIDDLLEVSRITLGKLRLSVRLIDLAPVVAAAIESTRPAAEAKGIRIQSILGSVGAVSGDPERLQQVVWNLLANAVKFTPKGGRIQVRLARVNSHLELVVSDTGIGIAPDFLPLIFERFRQFDSSTTRRYSGLGLGLAIVRHLVELHGGTVRAESAGEEKGATFVVELPLALVQPGAAAPPAAGATVAVGRAAELLEPSLEGVRVLVVEDDADGREVLLAMLTPRRAVVKAVGSAREALDALPGFRPDVILSDIEMPEEDGYGFLRRLRALPPDQGGTIPAAALTAFARTEDRRRAFLAGFQMHIPKPVDPGELIAIVATLAGRRE